MGIGQIAMFLATVASLADPVPGDEALLAGAAVKLAPRGVPGALARVGGASVADEAIAARIAARATAPRETINIAQRRLTHVLKRHVPGGIESAGRSVFLPGEDISALVRNAQAVQATEQAGQLGLIAIQGKRRRSIL